MKKSALALLIISALVLLVLLQIGLWLTRPAQHAIGPPPMDLPIRPISLPSQSGSNLRGWFVPGKRGAAGVLLMHGIHANRLAMLDRARFLHRAGYSIFLFDFQAHGESPRWRVTFGARESLNAHAAATYLCRQVQGEKVGAIGASLGGAAAPKGERAAILLAGFGRHRVRVPAGDRQGAVLWEIPPEGPLRTKVPLGAKFRGTVEQPIVRSVSKLQGNDPRLFSEDH